MITAAHGMCADTVRESALIVDSGRKIPCRTGESNLTKRCAGPTLYQLGYIPTYNTAVRVKACATVTVGGGAGSLSRIPFVSEVS